MNKKNISPNPLQPVDRIPTGQRPSALAELSEEAIGSLAMALPAGCAIILCSYGTDDDE